MTDEEAYSTYARVTQRYYMAHCWQEWEDRFHDGFLIFWQALQAGIIEGEPAGYAFGVAKGIVAHYRRDRYYGRKRYAVLKEWSSVYYPKTPDLLPCEFESVKRKAICRMRGVGFKKPYLQADILERSFIEDQSRAQVMAEMNMDYKSYSNCKSRALDTFGMQARRILRIS